MTFSDTGNTNAAARAPSGELAMSTAPSGTPGTSATDLPFSVAFWVRPDGINGTQNWLFGKAGGKWSAFYDNSNGIRGPFPLTFQLVGSTAADRQEAVFRASGLIWQEWVHVVMTYDGRGGSSAKDGMKIYLDGEEATVSLGTAGSYDGNDPVHGSLLYVGASYGGNNEATATMAEFAVWKDHELTLSEVRAVYDGSSYANAEYITDPSYISGISSAPARLQLRERDQRGNQYPLNLRLGS